MMSPAIFMLCALGTLWASHILITSGTRFGGYLRRRLLDRGSEWTTADTKRCFIVSCIVVMVIMHPTLVRQSMFLLMCVEIEGLYYLRKDVQLQCSTPAHNSMVVFVAAPGIILFVFAWPYLVYYLLKNRRHKLHLKGIAGHETRATYGFLYRGYKSSRYYWEITIMIRKTAMVMVATFGLRSTVQTQGMLALLVMALALTAHLKLQPYDDPILDKLEFFGLGAATVTLYFGMFFFTEDVVFAPWWGFVVTFVIILVNVLFSVVFGVSLFFALRDEYNSVNRLSTAIILHCKGSCTGKCMRFCPKLYVIFDGWSSASKTRHSREVQREILRNHNSRHSSFGGFTFDTASSTAHIEAKERSERRKKRILANQKVSKNKALTMMPIPLVHEHAQRIRIMTEAIRDADEKAKRRLSSQNNLLDLINKMQSNNIDDDEFSKSIAAFVRRRGTVSGDSAFLSGYHANVSNMWGNTLSAKKFGKLWKDKVQSRLINVEMVSMPDRKKAASLVSKSDDLNKDNANPRHTGNINGSAKLTRSRRESVSINPLFKKPGSKRALFPFQPSDDDEIELQNGDILEDIEELTSGWSIGKNVRTGQRGRFPSSYAE